MESSNNKFELVDIGANLTSRQLSGDLHRILSDAQQQNVSTIIITGTSESGSHEAYSMASKYKGFLYSTAGVHPHDAKSFTQQSLKTIRELATHPEVVSLGECGLDYDRMSSPADVQRAAFIEQIKLAIELKKPLFLHERSAHQDFVEIMEKNWDKSVKACVHCFTGTESELKKYISMGLYIGITGWICDVKRGEGLRKIVKQIPKDRLMIETDAPFLSPQNMPKFIKRNQPSHLPWVLKQLSESMGLSPEEVARATTANAQAFFNLSANASKQGRENFQKQLPSQTNNGGNNTNSGSSGKVCTYFNRPAGCRKGTECGLLHVSQPPTQRRPRSLVRDDTPESHQQSQQQQQPQENGAKPCPYFKKGNCKKGDECNMSHQQQPQQSQQTQQTQSNQQQQSQPQLQKPCPYFKKGECKKGDQCNMSHQQQPQIQQQNNHNSVYSQNQGQHLQQVDSNGAQQDNGAKPCPYFKRGNCKKGDECNMSHQQQAQQNQSNQSQGRLQQRNPKAVQSNQPTDNGLKLCPFYQKGNCKKGDECNMSHQQQQPQQNQPHQQSHANLPPRLRENHQQSQQQQQPQENGAKPCPYFKKGNCKKGDECNMSHQQQPQQFQTQQTQSNQQQQSQQNRQQNQQQTRAPRQPLQQQEEKVCPYFQRGNCKKGDQCNMLHQQQAPQAQQTQHTFHQNADFNKTPVNPAEVQCSFFKKGTCKKGDQCKFLHA